MTELAMDIIDVGVKYLGPEARRFLDRQAAHIDGLKFEDITEAELEKYAWWVGVSAKLIMDKDRALELSKTINMLRSAAEQKRIF